MNKKEKDELCKSIRDAIAALKGPYDYFDSKCYWLALLIGEDLSIKVHVWHSRLQLKVAVWTSQLKRRKP